MTRLARGDEEMGAGIIATNGPAIAGRLRDLRSTLDAWLRELERDGGPDAIAVAARLAAARRRLEEQG
jgi:prephenate dehydrogenase